MSIIQVSSVIKNSTNSSIFNFRFGEIIFPPSMPSFFWSTFVIETDLSSQKPSSTRFSRTSSSQTAPSLFSATRSTGLVPVLKKNSVRDLACMVKQLGKAKFRGQSFMEGPSNFSCARSLSDRATVKVSDGSGSILTEAPDSKFLDSSHFLKRKRTIHFI